MTEGVHSREIVVGPASIDANGHVNNVEYLRWMQDAAIEHATDSGSTAISRSIGASWVVRSNHVEYLRPAFEGDVLTVLTWVATVQKVQSLRKYLFRRRSDGATLVRGETNWIFVNATDGRLRPIPPEIAACFPCLPDPFEP